MEVSIRQANIKDSDIVPELMLQAMEEVIFDFIQKEDISEAIHFLTTLFKKENNQYSYQNTFVAVSDEEDIVGVIIAYNGDKLEELRQPVLNLMQKKYNNTAVPEPETQGNELYIDTLSVSPMMQGRGIGSILIKKILEFAKEQNYTKVGLLVDVDNPDAMRLYSRKGFVKGNQIEFAGGEYYHMYFAL